MALEEFDIAKAKAELKDNLQQVFSTIRMGPDESYGTMDLTDTKAYAALCDRIDACNTREELRAITSDSLVLGNTVMEALKEKPKLAYTYFNNAYEALKDKMDESTKKTYAEKLALLQNGDVSVIEDLFKILSA